MADTFQNQAVDEPAEFGEGEQALVKRWKSVV